MNILVNFKYKELTNMKTIKNIIQIIILAQVVLLVSCGGGDNPTPAADPRQEVIEALTKTWTVTSATFDDVTVSGDWNGFSLEFTDSQGYTTNASTDEQKLVWPTSGSYSFPDASNSFRILRSDGVEITISDLTETSATLSFQILQRSGRASGLIGEWIFVMEN